MLLLHYLVFRKPWFNIPLLHSNQILECRQTVLLDSQISRQYNSQTCPEASKQTKTQGVYQYHICRLKPVKIIGYRNRFLFQPRSQGLSSLPPLVVGTETLVAAGHVTIYPSKTAGWVHGYSSTFAFVNLSPPFQQIFLPPRFWVVT